MSELNLFWRSVSLWFWLLLRVAVMAAILFGSLLLSRTIFDPGVCFRGANHPIDAPHVKYIAVHVPLLLAYWLSANSIFRTTNRKTALQCFGIDTNPALPTVLIFGPIIGAWVVCIFGSAEYRVAVVGWVTGIVTAPVLLWVLFEPGVFQAFAKADEKAREAERKRRRNSPPNFALKLRILRRNYEDKIREINHMRIPEEEQLYLRELADTEYRNGVTQTIAGSNGVASGGNSASIESLLQGNEDN